MEKENPSVGELEDLVDNHEEAGLAAEYQKFRYSKDLPSDTRAVLVMIEGDRMDQQQMTKELVIEDRPEQVDFGKPKKPVQQLIRRTTQNIPAIPEIKGTDYRYEGEWPKYLGKRLKVEGVELNDPQFLRRYLPGSVNPYLQPQLQSDGAIRKVNEEQAMQMDQIIKEFEAALGSREETNYFKMREESLRTKWQAITKFLKDKVAKVIEKKAKHDNLVWSRVSLSTTPIFVNGPKGFAPTTTNFWQLNLPAEARVQYALYLTSDKNINIQDGIQLWQSFYVACANPEIATSVANKLSKYSGMLIYEQEEGKIKNGTAQQYPLQINENSFFVVMRLQTMRSNASSWKFHLKARTGVFDRILNTMANKISFGGFDPGFDLASVNAKMDAEFSQILKLVTFGASNFYISSSDEKLLTDFATLTTGKTYGTDGEGYSTLVSAYYNLNRAYYASRESLRENSNKRMNRYLNKDRSDVNRIRHFLGGTYKSK